MDNRLKEYAKLLIEVGLSLREGQTLLIYFNFARTLLGI